MMQSYYLVQIGVSYSSPCFFPYATGCIAAYLKKDSEIADFFDIPTIITMREPIEDILHRFKDPTFVAFSCYVWNYEYNKALAKAIKKHWPDAKIIFGGHNVTPGGDLLDELPYVDFLMHNEGEESTALFLKAIKNQTPLEEVPNLSFRKGNKILTTFDYLPSDLSEYPSPYTEEIFTPIMQEFPQTEFHAILETNRGCPYSCAYCEWCFTKKIRPFPIEKIRKEIEWIASNKIPYCYCADANFGILDRDVSIAEFVVEQKKKYGYPKVFKPCYAKESNDNVFIAGSILNSNNTDKGVTISYQTLDNQTLSNIGRRNISLEHFKKLEHRYAAEGIPTYSELILGLPGETFQSFKTGLCDLLESGQNNSIGVYECQVYPNSLIANKEYQKKYGIKTTIIPIFGIHYTPTLNGVQEYLEIITETASMPKSDWVKSNMFAVVLLTFHHMGLLRFFAVYLHDEKKIPYVDFYTKLFDYIYSDRQGYLFTLFKELYDRKGDVVSANWTYKRDVFGEVGWYFEEGAFLELAYHSEQFWEEIRPFLLSFNMDAALFHELFVFQKRLVRTLNVKEVEIFSHWSFYEFFYQSKPLTKKDCLLTIRVNKVITNWKDYAKEIIWFGKRYSATLLVNPREEIHYKVFDSFGEC